jgi:Uma2 family endonuclease
MPVTSARPETVPHEGQWERNGTIPPLEGGDRLSRDEFMRRYEAMSDLKKAELIDGVVYVSSSIRHQFHGLQHSELITWLCNYKAGTPGVQGSDNASLCLDLESIPQPDCVLFIQPENGGRVRINNEGYIVGAPELVAEVAASSASYDLHDKLRAYERNGVNEYVVWRVLDQQLDWFILRDGRYQQLPPSTDGWLRSPSFPGLWLDPAALPRGDLAAVLAVVEQGLSSPEHAEFKTRVEQQQAAEKSPG